MSFNNSPAKKVSYSTSNVGGTNRGSCQGSHWNGFSVPVPYGWSTYINSRAVKSGLINYQFAFRAAPVKFCPGRTPLAAIPARKVPCPLVSVEGTRVRGLSDSSASLICSPNVFCAIGCPAGIIAVGYAVRKIVFIIWETLIPNTDNSGSSILIAKGRRCGVANIQEASIATA